MSWHPDIPDLPITKPKIIEELEQADRRVLDSMPGAEIEDKVNSVAYAVAEAYSEKFEKGNYQGCFEFTSIALSVTGAALGGKFGTAMVAASQNAAKSASLIFFPMQNGKTSI